MNSELWNLNIEQLNALYRQESEKLEQSLLRGTAWEDVAEQRTRIGELFTIIYKKSNPAQFGPAENDYRRERNKPKKNP